MSVHVEQCKLHVQCQEINPRIDFNVVIAGAPKILRDGLTLDVKAKAGEPFKIKIPFKGSPAPKSTWYNVSTHLN